MFEGGFLGLDNIGVFDRSSPLPTGGYLEQADGTAWMALFSQNMLQMAIELAAYDPVYEDAALKYAEHFLWIAAAMDRIGVNQDEMWDEEDGFFYDLLRFPDGSATRLKIRSMVGLLPLCAATVLNVEVTPRFPRLRERIRRFLERQSRMISTIAPPDKPGVNGRLLLSILNEDKLRRVLAICWTRTNFSARTVSGQSRAIMPITPIFTIWMARICAWTTCRPNRIRACSAATRTGAVRSGCR